MKKCLDLKKLRNKGTKTISSEEALKDVEPYFTSEEISKAWKRAVEISNGKQK